MFEWVKGNAYTLLLTLYPNNITLNSTAASYFKDIRWCMIGVDKEHTQLAIRPVTKRDIDLQIIPMEHLHKVSVGKGYARISSKTTIEEISGLLHQQIDGLKINATFDEEENMLIADFHELIMNKG